MREDKLSTQSMDFAVMIIQLVKQLKSAHESIISNQIGRSGTQVSALISERRGMHMERLILYQNSKLRSKKRTKQAIG